MKKRRPSLPILIPLALSLSGEGCGEKGAGEEVVVYVSLDEHYSRPVLREFEARSGIKVLEVYDTEADKTTGLYVRLLGERARPRADVFWNSEALRTVTLAESGVLAPFDPPSAKGIPAAFRDPGERWTGFAGRARVILYNRELVRPEEAPRSIEDLAHPRWKGRGAIALPLFGTTATHAGALRAVLGREAMEDLFRRFKSNGVRVVNGNAVVRDLVVSGDVALGLTDTDDAHEAVRAGRPVTIVIPDQEGDFPGREAPLGAFLIPNTAGLVAGGPHPHAGRKLLDFLVSGEVELMLSRAGSAQIPLRPGLPAPPGLPLPEKLRVMEVDYAAAAKALEEAEPFLRDLFVR